MLTVGTVHTSRETQAICKLHSSYADDGPNLEVWRNFLLIQGSECGSTS